jgi:hypothetical protein
MTPGRQPMLWWIVDNVTLVMLVLGTVALCFAAAWWIRRNNKLLTGAGIAAGLMVLAFVLSLVIVTDRIQLTRNIETMRDLFNEGKLDEALEYFEDVIHADTVQGNLQYKKADLKPLARSNLKLYSVKRIVINSIDVEKVDRPSATVNFVIGPEDDSARGRCAMEFVLGRDGKWRVSKFGVTSYIGGQKSPLLFPFSGGG